VDPFLGEIQAFPYNFVPANWAACLGQILPIGSNTALFSLIGTYYGGNGSSTFALPNLNGNIVNGQGNGPGLQPRSIGENLGVQNVSLASGEMARHTHNLQIGVRNGLNGAPGPGTGSNMAMVDPEFNGFVAPPTTTSFSPNAMGLTGGGQAHPNNQPTLAIVYCIALRGIFPSFDSA
jgi:microcystin-dependent protein